MRKLLVLAAAILALSACNNTGDDKKDDLPEDSTNNGGGGPQAASMAAKTDADGYTVLFDGVSTAGWHRYGGGVPGTSWKVMNGELILDSAAKMDGGNLVSNDEYENFDLKLEWKIAKNGNSGIMWGVHDDSTEFKEPYYTGPEMQIVDNEGHPDGKLVKHQAGDLYDLISSSTKSAKPAGEWNEAEVKLVNGKLDLYLNGNNVVSTTMWDDNWKKMVAGSKFKQWPAFGTFKKGHIVLQDHGNMVSFRNVRIKTL
jgi:hypothetical protein